MKQFCDASISGLASVKPLKPHGKMGKKYLSSWYNIGCGVVGFFGKAAGNWSI